MKYIGVDNLTPLRSPFSFSFFPFEVRISELTKKSRSKAEVFVPVDAPRYANFIFFFRRKKRYSFLHLQWSNYGHGFSQVDGSGNCMHIILSDYD